MTTHRWVASVTFLLLLASFGRAEACSTAAWSATVGSASAVEPFEQAGATRYSGHCALGAVPGTVGHVVDNTPSDTVYRARFQVYTGTSDASPTIFRATSADNLTATALLSVAYSGPLQRLEFSAAGETLVVGVSRNRWVAIEVLYQGGVPLQAWATHRGVQATLVGTSNLPAVPVESVGLGVVAASAGTGRVYVDEFDSTRSSSTRIGPLCRGDSSADGAIGLSDASFIATERVQRVLASGQPDCNEDGVVDVFDVACTHRRRIDGDGCSLFGKSWLKLPLGVFADGFESPA